MTSGRVNAAPAEIACRPGQGKDRPSEGWAERTSIGKGLAEAVGDGPGNGQRRARQGTATGRNGTAIVIEPGVLPQ